MKMFLLRKNVLRILSKESYDCLNVIYCSFNLVLVFTISFIYIPDVNGQISDDGGVHSVESGATDYLLPMNPLITDISFRLKGGDGGYARVYDKYYQTQPVYKTVHVNYKANGGEGAQVTATFPVGNGPHEIPLGSIIRFVVGGKGQSGIRDAWGGWDFECGGGGGGSAVLIKPPGGTEWTLLAVAGGGGGGLVEMYSSDERINLSGQGGRSGPNGGSGTGDSDQQSGGIGGEGGGGSQFAGGGGGKVTDGVGRTCEVSENLSSVGEGGAGGHSIGHGGYSEGCAEYIIEGEVALVWRNGGAGYGGGGAGTVVRGIYGSKFGIFTASGGGGGGFSGGGAGGFDGSGGGGGSFVSEWATSPHIETGGTTGDPDQGFITYETILNIAPIVNCKPTTIYLDENSETILKPSDIDNISYDPDGIFLEMEVSKDTFDCGDVGPNNVILTVTDADGAMKSCTTTVMVLDNISPNTICKNITVFLDDMGEARISPMDLDNGSSDNCGIAQMELSTSTLTCENVGMVNHVTITVTDKNDNKSNCTAKVSVLDTIAPTAIGKDIKVYLDASGKASIAAMDVDGGSFDNCGIAFRSIEYMDFTCENVGTPVEVKLIVKDKSGNSDSTTVSVVILDKLSPSAVCNDIKVYLDEKGVATITSDDVDAGTIDNCGIDTIFLDTYDFSCANSRKTSVKLTAVDINGNQASCVSMVEVLDTIIPTVLTRNIEVSLDNNGIALIRPEDVDNGSHDFCGISLMELDVDTFTCEDLGVNMVQLAVTDISGNTASKYAHVKIVDNIEPFVKTKNVVVTLGKFGSTSVKASDIDGGSWDNCTIAKRWLEGLTTFDCGSVGVHEVVLFVEDQSGNVDSESALVTVESFEPDFTNAHGVANGDTVHIVDCLPWDISQIDLVHYRTIKKHAKVTSSMYRQVLPENAPWSMYELWQYEYKVEDGCFHTWTFTFYLALYDLTPPTFLSFPSDTIVATVKDVPDVDEDVRIIDVCQYVVWDTVVTLPILDRQMTDTIGFTRRWMARDPVGHQSFRDQMIWIGSGDRDHFGLIMGRIADENHLVDSRFSGQPGINGIPVNLYRIDTTARTRTWVDSWTTGDWQGAQGKFYFVVDHPGLYRVKIDSAICLVDTLKWDKHRWSDTLEVAVGEVIDQGWVITSPCVLNDSVQVDTFPTLTINSTETTIPDTKEENDSQKTGVVVWNIYPNPARNYVRIDIHSDVQLDFRVYDALGRMVRTGQYQRGHTIEIRNLKTGVYYIQLASQDEIIGTKKVLFME